jgi:predicted ArsR family transcriptional regulator
LPVDSRKSADLLTLENKIPDSFGDTKKAILWRLKSRGESDLVDLAKTLKISRMAVHKHLVALEERGLVESEEVKKGRVGRPKITYRLSSRGKMTFPRAYGGVAKCALKFIEKKLGKKAVEQMLRERQSEIFARYSGELKELEFDDRVKKLAELRDSEGYMAESRKLPSSKYVLFEHNCPIIQLAEDYWEACTTETELFRNLLGAKVEATHRAAKGDLVCRFMIEPRETVPSDLK